MFSFTLTVLSVLFVISSQSLFVLGAPTPALFNLKRATMLATGTSGKRVTGTLPNGLQWQATGQLAKGCDASTGIKDCFSLSLTSNPNSQLDPKFGDRQRIEFRTPNGKAGKTQTYTWKYNVPANTPTSEHFFHMMQVFSETKGGPLITLDAVDGALGFTDFRSGAPKKSQLPSAKISKFAGRTTLHKMVVTWGTKGKVSYTIADANTGEHILSYSNSGNLTPEAYLKFGTYRKVFDGMKAVHSEAVYKRLIAVTAPRPSTSIDISLLDYTYADASNSIFWGTSGFLGWYIDIKGATIQSNRSHHDSHMLSPFVTAAGAIALYYLFKVVRLFVRPVFSPLRDLPGPKTYNLILGHLGYIHKSENSPGELREKWVEEYGKTFVYKGFVNTDQIFTVDLRALNHILTHASVYQKPAQGRKNLARILGNGILVTEGEKHRQQRRVMNPSFSPASIRELTPVFFRKAIQLRDIWKSALFKDNAPKRIDIMSWLSRTTLDIVGLAVHLERWLRYRTGFDYKFHSLTVDQEPNELSKALSTLFHADGVIRLIPILKAIFPILHHIPTKRTREMDHALKTMHRIGEGLISDRKRQLLGQDSMDKSKNGDALHEDENDVLSGEDLLSALMKANMDTDVPEQQRMSDEDVLYQIPTFFVAGHETTSSETMWCLHALSYLPEIQAKLREELLTVQTDTPSMAELDALPYLDVVMRETLRLHAAVPATFRQAAVDDVIPLSEPYKDRKGQLRYEIRQVYPHGCMAISAIWGDDVLDFKPERWFNLPDAVNSIPGVWGSLLTFLGGSRSCIGYRFALIEMKALLFTLIRAFEFTAAVPKSEIQTRSIVVQRPYLRSDKDGPAQMPLIIKPYVKSV
ncbi:cytochrome P450 [Rickenella mellea]|uniref:Cytochrome P450 n=1 Tax=Rickenella mellea TaxID=50990 RepID=A0A4Y7Q027_9AGAM|nr:cytochrome P450 [Rickenella mellea]